MNTLYINTINLIFISSVKSVTNPDRPQKIATIKIHCRATLHPRQQHRFPRRRIIKLYIVPESRPYFQFIRTCARATRTAHIAHVWEAQCAHAMHRMSELMLMYELILADSGKIGGRSTDCPESHSAVSARDFWSVANTNADWNTYLLIY